MFLIFRHLQGSWNGSLKWMHYFSLDVADVLLPIWGESQITVCDGIDNKWQGSNLLRLCLLAWDCTSTSAAKVNFQRMKMLLKTQIGPTALNWAKLEHQWGFFNNANLENSNDSPQSDHIRSSRRCFSHCSTSVLEFLKQPIVSHPKDEISFGWYITSTTLDSVILFKVAIFSMTMAASLLLDITTLNRWWHWTPVLVSSNDSMANCWRSYSGATYRTYRILIVPYMYIDGKVCAITEHLCQWSSLTF